VLGAIGRELANGFQAIQLLVRICELVSPTGSRGLGRGRCRDQFRPGRESGKIDQPNAIGPLACLTKAELDGGPVLPIPAAPMFHCSDCRPANRQLSDQGVCRLAVLLGQLEEHRRRMLH
jgi:hypothetical protein